MGGLLLAISVAEGKISSNIALAIIDVTIPLLKDVKTQAPKAICELAPPTFRLDVRANSLLPPKFDEAAQHAGASAVLWRK